MLNTYNLPIDKWRELFRFSIILFGFVPIRNFLSISPRANTVSERRVRKSDSLLSFIKKVLFYCLLNPISSDVFRWRAIWSSEMRNN